MLNTSYFLLKNTSKSKTTSEWVLYRSTLKQCLVSYRRGTENGPWYSLIQSGQTPITPIDSYRKAIETWLRKRKISCRKLLPSISQASGTKGSFLADVIATVASLHRQTILTCTSTSKKLRQTSKSSLSLYWALYQKRTFKYTSMSGIRTVNTSRTNTVRLGPN